MRATQVYSEVEPRVGERCRARVGDGDCALPATLVVEIETTREGEPRKVTRVTACCLSHLGRRYHGLLRLGK